MAEKPTVTDIFQFALDLRKSDPNGSYDDVKNRIVDKFGAGSFPDTAYLTIPEYDSIVPEEDWTSGLPVVLRGIQNDSWKEVAHGIVISLEQVENYPKESLREDDPSKDWRNRNEGIADAEAKVLEKWMPEDLMDIARRQIRA